MTDISDKLDEFRKFIQGDEALKRELKKIKNPRQFWNVLKTDLMVRLPKEVKAFLVSIDTQTRLADIPEGSKVGALLASKFKDENNEADLRLCQQALIMACLELGTSIRLESVDTDFVNENQKTLIAKRLAIW